MSTIKFRQDEEDIRVIKRKSQFSLKLFIYPKLSIKISYRLEFSSQKVININLNEARLNLIKGVTGSNANHESQNKLF